MTHALDQLFATITARRDAGDTTNSYTARLLSEGVAKCAKKFGEEAVEAALAAVSGDKDHLAAESADVLYHLAVLWAAAGVTPEDVYAKLKAREGQSGLAEKAARDPGKG
ncbi:MAG TPA: phosphoribosyl-ATP diphosphatase [Rhizomicrobium sp.]|nr:phosphoribosyl-ATP diphosphatase [Rhizomicrobium sp.]